MMVDGRKIADEILGRLKRKPAPAKFLAAVLVGDNAASESFLKQKEKIARELGVGFQRHRFSGDIGKDALREEIQKIAVDPECGGVIIQLPLPDRAMEQEILDGLPPQKDIDVLGVRALKAFHDDRNAIPPPVVGVVQELLASRFTALGTSLVAVVGRGKLVGQPVAAWLKGKTRELIVVDEGDDLGALSRADLIISGAGVPGLITPAMLKETAFVIDFGYGMRDGKVMGDFDSSSSPFPVPRSPFYTPTPGGTGPILVAKLFENFYTLNAR
jgi:methylenetetrahydrofolate dehydrogenase (NADP+)/methenyltetrahydrofolate cyclohydrolase